MLVDTPIKEKKLTDEKNNSNVSKLELVHSGDDYFFRLLQLIANAQTEIHIQTYIFRHDSTGTEIANALIAAAARNVKIYLLLDAYGSSKLSKPFINKLIKNGIELRFFSSLFSMNNIYLGRRLHHKVAVADGKIGLLGGINISDKYHGSKKEFPWLDYAVQINDIKIAKQLQRLCRTIYFKKLRTPKRKRKSAFHQIDEVSVRIIENDWLKRKNEISSAYIQAVQHAKKEICIIGSYYLPGRKFTHVLKEAAQRGVKIKLILAGVSDVPMVRRATCYLYASLLQQNIELYEWQSSVLHGKVAVVDNEWSTIGSFNLNHLSSYGSIEMNLEIKSNIFSKTLQLNLNRVISKCDQITMESLKTKNKGFTKFSNWLAYRLIRTALIIVTYLPYKRFYQNLLK